MLPMTIPDSLELAIVVAAIVLAVAIIVRVRIKRARVKSGACTKCGCDD